jgi:hypothetical protein
MGSNPSRRKTRAAVLACPIGHFRGGVLIVTRPTCREHREVPVNAIIGRIGAAHPVKAVVEQLRCSVPGCGAVPCGVTIRGRLHEVVLVGPGAYG